MSTRHQKFKTTGPNGPTPTLS